MASTHSPDFISFRSNQCVYRLNRSGSDLRVGVLRTAEVPEAAKCQELLDEQGNHELLFGNAAILCEGKDDVIALRHFLLESGVDLDGGSVSVVGLGGVGTLPAYAKMAADLGIPWCGLTDEDLQDDGSVKPATAKVRAKLDAMRSDRDALAVWPGSLEAALGVPEGKKATPDWQRENLLDLDAPTIVERYPEFAETCRAVASWLTD